MLTIQILHCFGDDISNLSEFHFGRTFTLIALSPWQPTKFEEKMEHKSFELLSRMISLSEVMIAVI